MLVSPETVSFVRKVPVEAAQGSLLTPLLTVVPPSFQVTVGSCAAPTITQETMTDPPLIAVPAVGLSVTVSTEMDLETMAEDPSIDITNSHVYTISEEMEVIARVVV